MKSKYTWEWCYTHTHTHTHTHLPTQWVKEAISVAFKTVDEHVSVSVCWTVCLCTVGCDPHLGHWGNLWSGSRAEGEGCPIFCQPLPLLSEARTHCSPETLEESFLGLMKVQEIEKETKKRRIAAWGKAEKKTDQDMLSTYGTFIDFICTCLLVYLCGYKGLVEKLY